MASNRETNMDTHTHTQIYQNTGLQPLPGWLNKVSYTLAAGIASVAGQNVEGLISRMFRLTLNPTFHLVLWFHRLQANDVGDFFPIWGTCQGFQQLTVLTAKKNVLTLTDTSAVALPLTFTPGTAAGPSRRAEEAEHRSFDTVGTSG